MKSAIEKSELCPKCGQAHQAGDATCPPGGGSGQDDDKTEWVRVRDSLKLKWVASVLAFWVSASVLAVVAFLDNRIDLTLTSICLGMLIIGIWLKTRYRLHLRTDPGRQ